DRMKIVAVGSGYVGLSNAVVLARHHEVVVLDVDARKVDQVNQGDSPIEDAGLQRYLREEPLDLKATVEPEQAYAGTDFVVVATPTDYDEQTHYFNTASVESVVADVVRIN